MEIPQLTAAQFIRQMSAGRTRPVLLGAETSDGKLVEVVTKLRGPHLDLKAQIAELVSAPLAAHLGLQVPSAALVNIPDGFDAIVPRENAAAFRASLGLNFGSIHLGPSFTLWPGGRCPVGVQQDQAAEIFAFDLLVQNPDRKTSNTNLWSLSERLGVYDHELAFTFLYLHTFGGTLRPWVTADQAGALRLMQDHAFYQCLRGKTLDLGSFESRLATLTDETIANLLNLVPAQWRDGHDFCEKARDYLREARDQRTGFLSFINHILR